MIASCKKMRVVGCGGEWPNTMPNYDMLCLRGSIDGIQFKADAMECVGCQGKGRIELLTTREKCEMCLGTGWYYEYKSE